MENLSFFHEQKDKSELFSTNKLYWKRIYEIQEDVLQLNRYKRFYKNNHILNYKNIIRDVFGDTIEEIKPETSIGEYLKLGKDPFLVYEIFDHILYYKNIIRDGFGNIIEEINPEISFEEYLKLRKEPFLVYEIFDYMEKRKRIQLINILIYYPQSRICFIYQSKNHHHVMLFGFYFKEIIRNIDKDELDSIYLYKKRDINYEILAEKQPYRVSNIMNPDGYVHFPKEYETLFEKYVNQTNKPYLKQNLKYFRNYLWIHYHHMNPIEKKYRKKLIFNELMKKEELPLEIIEYIISYL